MSLLSPSSQSLTLVEHKLVPLQMVLYGKDQAPAQLLAVAFPAAIMESIICMAFFRFFCAALSALLLGLYTQGRKPKISLETAGQKEAHTSLQLPLTGSSQL
jgi:hypothetical protein